MEFQDVVRRRRMVRRYSVEPVGSAALERVLRNATRAPSAGFAQGSAFLVLDRPDDVARYWEVCAGDREPDAWLEGMRTAPVLVIPCSSRDAYLARYAEADKSSSDLSTASGETRWPMPYWHMDTAMAVMLMLQTAVDEGLGACYFGIPPEREGAVRAEFGIPADWDPIGAVTLGHPAPGHPTGSPTRRARKPLEEVVHRGRW